MPAGLGEFSRNTVDGFARRLQAKAKPHYDQGDADAGRMEVEKLLSESLDNIADAFRFPDEEYGLAIMALVAAQAGRFLLDAGDVAGAKQLAARDSQFSDALALRTFREEIK